MWVFHCDRHDLDAKTETVSRVPESFALSLTSGQGCRLMGKHGKRGKRTVPENRQGITDGYSLAAAVPDEQGAASGYTSTFRIASQPKETSHLHLPALLLAARVQR